MKNNIIHILWDCSQLWGIMAWRALRLMGVPARLALARKIAQGNVLRKQPGILLVPGGSARQKAGALGPAGLEAVRGWIRDGGAYLGLCGGAGLALSHDSRQISLGICPWGRKTYKERLYHLVSGPLLAQVGAEILELPVWWPGRFAEDEAAGVDILARYAAPGQGLWLADMPVMETPAEILDQWRGTGGLDAALNIPVGQPLIISGKYGAGRYVLSYVHLETPAAGDANNLLALLLKRLGDGQISARHVPPWKLDAAAAMPEWGPEMAEAMASLYNLLALGEKLGFFFRRMPWLWGWRRGAPGMACNNLLACLATVAQMRPTEAAMARWLECKREFAGLMAAFARNGGDWIWRWRLAETLQAGAAQKRDLEKKRGGIFGHPMLGGGISARLLAILEELIYLCQPEDP